MSIKICWTKDFIGKNIQDLQPAEGGREKTTNRKPSPLGCDCAVHTWKFGHYFYGPCFCISCSVTGCRKRSTRHLDLLGDCFRTCFLIQCVAWFDNGYTYLRQLYWERTSGKCWRVQRTLSCVSLRGFMRFFTHFSAWRWTPSVRCLAVATLPLVASRSSCVCAHTDVRCVV